MYLPSSEQLDFYWPKPFKAICAAQLVKTRAILAADICHSSAVSVRYVFSARTPFSLPCTCVLSMMTVTSGSTPHPGVTVSSFSPALGFGLPTASSQRRVFFCSQGMQCSPYRPVRRHAPLSRATMWQIPATIAPLRFCAT